MWIQKEAFFVYYHYINNAYIVGGSEKGPKPGYVIYEWSLSKCRSTTMVHDVFVIFLIK